MMVALAFAAAAGAVWLALTAVAFSERGGFVLNDWSAAPGGSDTRRITGRLVFRWLVGGRCLVLVAVAVAVAAGFLAGRL